MEPQQHHCNNTATAKLKLFSHTHFVIELSEHKPYKLSFSCAVFQCRISTQTRQMPVSVSVSVWMRVSARQIPLDPPPLPSELAKRRSSDYSRQMPNIYSYARSYSPCTQHSRFAISMSGHKAKASSFLLLYSKLHVKVRAACSLPAVAGAAVCLLWPLLHVPLQWLVVLQWPVLHVPLQCRCLKPGQMS